MKSSMFGFFLLFMVILWKPGDCQDNPGFFAKEIPSPSKQYASFDLRVFNFGDAPLNTSFTLRPVLKRYAKKLKVADRYRVIDWHSGSFINVYSIDDVIIMEMEAIELNRWKCTPTVI